MTRLQRFKDIVANATAADMGELITYYVDEPCDYCIWRDRKNDSLLWCYKNCIPCSEGVAEWLSGTAVTD